MAFSGGGTDSAFVLWAAKAYGCAVRAYYVRTAFQPAFEREDAKRLTDALGVPMTEVPVDILAVPGAAENGPDRCYHCKKALFSALWQRAPGRRYTVLLDGTTLRMTRATGRVCAPCASWPCARRCASVA